MNDEDNENYKIIDLLILEIMDHFKSICKRSPESTKTGPYFLEKYELRNFTILFTYINNTDYLRINIYTLNEGTLKNIKNFNLYDINIIQNMVKYVKLHCYLI